MAGWFGSTPNTNQLQATPNPLKVNPKPGLDVSPSLRLNQPQTTPRPHPHEDLSQPKPPSLNQPPATPNCHPIRANRRPQVQVMLVMPGMLAALRKTGPSKKPDLVTQKTPLPTPPGSRFQPSEKRVVSGQAATCSLKEPQISDSQCYCSWRALNSPIRQRSFTWISGCPVD